MESEIEKLTEEEYFEYFAEIDANMNSNNFEKLLEPIKEYCDNFNQLSDLFDSSGKFKGESNKAFRKLCNKTGQLVYNLTLKFEEKDLERIIEDPKKLFAVSFKARREAEERVRYQKQFSSASRYISPDKAAFGVHTALFLAYVFSGISKENKKYTFKKLLFDNNHLSPRTSSLFDGIALPKIVDHKDHIAKRAKILLDNTHELFDGAYSKASDYDDKMNKTMAKDIANFYHNIRNGPIFFAPHCIDGMRERSGYFNFRQYFLNLLSQNYRAKNHRYHLSFEDALLKLGEFYVELGWAENPKLAARDESLLEKAGEEFNCRTHKNYITDKKDT